MTNTKQFTRREFLKTAGVAAGAAIAAPLLQACGGAATAAPLKIGVLLPYSGIYAALGESITSAMEMYLGSVNNTAGGRAITFIKEDEGTDPAGALQKARKLVEQDEVAFVTGVVSSGVLAGLRDYFISSKKLLVCSNAGANALSRKAKTPYIWRTSFTNWMPNWPVGTWAAQNVGKKAYISVPDYGAGNDTISALSNSFKAAGGEVMGVQKTPFPNIGDAAPFVTELANAKPDFVYTFYSGGAAVTFMKAWEAFGLVGKLPLLSSGFMVEEDVLPAEGNAALGVRSGLHWSLVLDNAENKKFSADYKARTTKDANVFAVQGYDTGRVIVEMLNKVQGNTSNVDAMIQALGGISFASPRGAYALDANTQAPRQHIYLREVKPVGDALHNAILMDMGEIVDPGDDSKG